MPSGRIPDAVRVRRGFPLEPSLVSRSTRGFDGVVSAYDLETRIAVITALTILIVVETISSRDADDASAADEY
jgi:hypothetical protein